MLPPYISARKTGPTYSCKTILASRIAQPFSYTRHGLRSTSRICANTCINSESRCNSWAHARPVQRRRAKSVQNRRAAQRLQHTLCLAFLQRRQTERHILKCFCINAAHPGRHQRRVMEPGRTQHHFKSALRHRLHRHARRGVEAFHGRIHLQKRFFHRSPVLQSQPDAARHLFCAVSHRTLP